MELKPSPAPQAGVRLVPLIVPYGIETLDKIGT